MPNVLSAERQVLAPDPQGGSTGGFLRLTERRIAVARLPATGGRNHAVADHDSSLSARLPCVREERNQTDGPQEPLAAYDSWSFDRLACVGVFLLWGHSWELQATAQWHHLDEALRFMSEFTSQAPSLTNGQICQHASSRSAHVDETAPKVHVIRSEL